MASLNCRCMFSHTSITEALHDLSHGTSLLTNGHINTVEFLLYKRQSQHREKTNELNFTNKMATFLLSSSPSLKRFWLMMVSMAMAVFLYHP